MFIFKKKRKNGTVTSTTMRERAESSPPDGTTDSFASLYMLWGPKLKGMSAQLHTISKETENEFLVLGSNLQMFSSGCVKSSSDASSIVTMIEGGSGLNVTALTSLFEQAHTEMGSCADAVSGGFNGIADLVSRINEIVELKMFMEKLSRSISILGTLMKTETARITEEDFSTMTIVIDELARDIESNTDEIDTIVKNAKVRLINSRDGMQATITQFSNDLRSNKELIHVILKELDEMTMQAALSCRNIEERAAQISPEVGNIVTALQYHDICRQQMEHVGEVLEEIAVKSAAANTVREDERAALGQWIINALAIQISQLDHVIGETARSAETITSHLSQVAALAEAQGKEVELLLDEKGGGENRISMIRSGLGFLSTLLSHSKNMIIDISTAVSDSNSNISSLSKQVSNIQEISEDITILAMNTILKSSRTGETGKGLGVLANEIRKLSTTAQSRIEKGTEAIAAILTSSADLEQQLSEHLTAKLANSDTILQQTHASMQEMETAHHEIKRALAEIIKSVQSLEADITKITKGITFNNTIEKHLGAIIADLRAILDEAVKRVPDGADAVSLASHNLHDLAHRYTMQSERKVHEAALNLIKGNGNGPSQKQRTSTADLGSNVELF